MEETRESDEQLENLKQEYLSLWKGIASKGSEQDLDQGPLFLGGNVRINVAKALETVYKSAVLVIKAKGVVVTGDTSVLMDMPGEFFSLVVSALNAVREKVGPLAYVACVVLASNDQGLTDEELKAGLVQLLDEDGAKRYPWYLGLTHDRLVAARENLANSDFEDLRKSLVRGGWAIEVAGAPTRLKRAPRSFTWRLS